MAEDHDGKDGSEAAPEGPEELYFNIKINRAGGLTTDTNVKDALQRYGILVAALEAMFRTQTMSHLEAMATRSRIVSPDGVLARMGLRR